MANLTLIEAKTLGSSVASVTFNSIPQTYTDLRIVMSARYDQNGDSRTFFNFNGTGYNASSNTITAYGTGTGAENFSSNGILNLAAYTGTGQDTGTFANASFDIPNYTTLNNKTIIGQAVQESNVATIYNTLGAGLWTSSVAAITSIQIAPAAGNFITGSTFYLYGVTSASYGAKATGGIITSDSSYFYHTFLSSGTFTPSTSISADVLVIAGGGSAATRYGGGGGAGGLCVQSSRSIAAGSYAITIGSGGAGVAIYVQPGNNGTNTTFDTVTAIGGGGGGGANNSGPEALTGGSGGGGGGYWAPGITGAAATQGNSGGATGYGFAGGNGKAGEAVSGGGGGAGGVGQTGTGSESGGNAKSGNGGIGRTDSLLNALGAVTGTGQLSGGNYYYAGGGGGGGRSDANTTAPGTGGLGGGGAGSIDYNNGGNGTANTGGGSGGSWNGSSGNGGSGLVVIRYAK